MDNVYFHAETNTGRIRKNNEDAYIAQTIWDDKHYLFVVIDGMGGYEGGEVAAEIVQRSIVGYLEDFSSGKKLDLLKQAVLDANNEIIRYKSAYARYSSMGCVVTAGLLDKETSVLNVVHVGDTRLYMFSDNGLQKLTHDHTLVGYQEEKGELTEEEAMNHPQRSVIERYMGETIRALEDKNFLDAAIFPISQSSQLLFCSDGLYDMITSREISQVLATKDAARAKAETLIELANGHGGKDNVTVIVVDIEKNACKETSTQEKAVVNGIVPKPPTSENEGTFARASRWIFAVVVAFLAGLACGFLFTGKNHNASEKPIYISIEEKDSILQLLESKNKYIQALSMRLIEQDDSTKYPLIEAALRDSVLVLKRQNEELTEMNLELESKVKRYQDAIANNP